MICEFHLSNHLLMRRMPYAPSNCIACGRTRSATPCSSCSRALPSTRVLRQQDGRREGDDRTYIIGKGRSRFQLLGRDSRRNALRSRSLTGEGGNHTGAPGRSRTGAPRRLRRRPPGQHNRGSLAILVMSKFPILRQVPLLSISFSRRFLSAVL